MKDSGLFSSASSSPSWWSESTRVIELAEDKGRGFWWPSALLTRAIGPCISWLFSFCRTMMTDNHRENLLMENVGKAMKTSSGMRD